MAALKRGIFRHPVAREAALLGGIVVAILVLSLVTMRRSVLTQPQFALAGGDAAHGRDLFVQNCASCHGLSAQGLPHQGANLRGSRFVSSENDYTLVKFLRSGREPGDPKTVMGLQMPARGGNKTLEDAHLANIVAYLREVQKQPQTIAAPTTRPTLTLGPPELGG